jgi:hypothetical protein
MKSTKILVAVAASVIGLTTIGLGTASASTLRVGGVLQNKAVTIWAVGKTGTSTTLAQTNSAVIETCTEPAIHMQTSTFTGASVSGTVSTLAWGGCTHTTDTQAAGSLSISHIAGTTNGTIRSSGAQWQVTSTTFGATLTCTTNNTHLGTLTGATTSTGHATMDINAVVNCGFFCPSAVLSGTLTVEVPDGLAVES